MGGCGWEEVETASLQKQGFTIHADDGWFPRWFGERRRGRYGRASDSEGEGERETARAKRTNGCEIELRMRILARSMVPLSKMNGVPRKGRELNGRRNCCSQRKGKASGRGGEAKRASERGVAVDVVSCGLSRG